MLDPRAEQGVIKSVPFKLTCQVVFHPGRGYRYDAYPDGLTYPRYLQQFMWTAARRVDYDADAFRLGWNKR